MPNQKEGTYIILNQEGSQETTLVKSLNRTNSKAKSIQIICQENKAELIEDYFTCLNSQITPIIVNPGIPSEKLKQLEAKLLENHYDNSPLGHVTCSSGTTSSNGPIKAFHFELDRPIENSQAHYKSLEIDDSKKILFPMPLTHSFGVVVGLLGTQCFGHKLYTFNTTPKNNILLEAIENNDIEVLYLTPTLARLLMKFMKRKKLTINRSLKISIGSAHIYKSELKELMNFFPHSDFYYTYGLSEVGPRVSTLKCGNKESNILEAITGETLPIGEALAGIKLDIIDNCLHVHSQYSNTGINSEYFNTQDEAQSIDDRIYLRGRIDNTINFAGVNIYPQEIEPIINQITNKKCILLGMPSKLQGEVPVLVIEALNDFETSFDQKNFIQQLSKELPINFHPQRIFFLEEFPTTSMGKIKRKEVLTKIS